jgi:C4-dicarboxylate-specific signal transduction histidine kinase
MQRLARGHAARGAMGMPTTEDEPSGRVVAAGAGIALQSLFRNMESLLDMPASGYEAAALRGMAARGARLAEELLAYAGRLPLSPQRVEPEPFLDGLADALRRTLDASFNVRVEIAPGCPACLADPAALEDALLRLVANGRDAMPAGGGLCLEARPAQLPGGVPAVQLAVRDQGSGMPASLHATAAWPFVTTKQRDPFAGLGLAAVDGFARQSGGRMHLETSTRGTLCSLLLPASVTSVQPHVMGFT